MRTQAAKPYFDLYYSQAKVKCLEGGSRSGKTWSILIYLLCSKKFEGSKITVLRKELTTLKRSVIDDLEEVTDSLNLPIHPYINRNRPDQTYQCMGRKVTFIGADEWDKLTGRKQDVAWFNEAMEIEKRSFDEVEQRTSSEIILDYNPVTKSHWIYNIQNRDDVDTFRSTILDNPFAPKAVREKILSYEPTEENIRKGTADEYMWKVYGKGERAAMEGLVYPYWDYYEEADAEWEIHGLDLGFSNDPTALVKVSGLDNAIYVEELVYTTDLTNQELSERMKAIGMSATDRIVVDSADPRSIEELYRMGWNAHPSTKGQDSVMHGIQAVRGMKLYIHKNSLNLLNEMENYVFEKDKEGNSLNAPRKENDHLMDAMRYAVTHKLLDQKQLLWG